MAQLLQASQRSLLRCQPFTGTVLRTSVTLPYDHTAVSPQALNAAKPFKQIPGYRKMPMFGTAWIFFPVIGKFTLERAHRYDSAKYEKFGPISRDVFGHLSVVSLYDPHDIETVFRNEGKYPSRGELSTLKAYRKMRKQWFSTMGIMILNGKEWKDLRFKLQRNMMKTKVIERYVTPMEEVAKDLIASIKRNKNEKNEIPEILGEFYKWSLESVAYIGLDSRLGCLNEYPNEEAGKLIESVQGTFECMNRLEPLAGNFPLWQWIPTPTWKKFVRIMDFFSRVITSFKYVNKTLDAVKAKGPSVKEGELTLAQLMMLTENLDVGGTVTMIVDMLFAGVDTTSHTLAFLLYDLAKNPEKQEKMYREIIGLLPKPSDRITPEVLQNITYAKYCLRESQRLNPIVRGVARMTEKDMVLGGYRVPAGTTVLSLLQVVGRQEKYFKNANKFIPERWMDEQNKSHPFAFMPFGFGIRSCIGRRIAELEIQCALVEIIRNFKVEYHYEDFDILTRLVNVPDRPLKFSFLSRAAHG